MLIPTNQPTDQPTTNRFILSIIDYNRTAVTGQRLVLKYDYLTHVTHVIKQKRKLVRHSTLWDSAHRNYINFCWCFYLTCYFSPLRSRDKICHIGQLLTVQTTAKYCIPVGLGQYKSCTSSLDHPAAKIL